MKIRDVKRPRVESGVVREAARPDEGYERAIVFRRTLSGLQSDAQSSYMAAIIEEIDKQGARLSQRADVGELERYRALIKKFLDEVVSNSYAFSKENSFEARGRHRLFAVVKTINGKLDELGKQVLAGQADNLRVLAAVDEIRGLILDMML